MSRKVYLIIALLCLMLSGCRVDDENSAIERCMQVATWGA